MKKMILLAALVGATIAVQASIITFEGTGINQQIPADWASNIAADGTGFNISNGATPNVTLDWSTSGTDKIRWDFYNDDEWSVGQMNNFTNEAHYLSFAPDAGYSVILDSFIFDDFADYNGGNDFSWNLFKDTVGGTTIASGSATTTDGQNLVVNTGMAVAYAGTIVLELTNNEPEGGGYDQAIDNVTFRQVPEPLTLSLVAGVGGAILFINRRLTR